MDKDMNRYLSNDEIEKTHDKKKYSVSLTIREMQIKTIMRFHLTLMRMAYIQKSIINNYW